MNVTAAHRLSTQPTIDRRAFLIGGGSLAAAATLPRPARAANSAPEFALVAAPGSRISRRRGFSGDGGLDVRQSRAPPGAARAPG